MERCPNISRNTPSANYGPLNLLFDDSLALSRFSPSESRTVLGGQAREKSRGLWDLEKEIEF
jgi:hypothetical protein